MNEREKDITQLTADFQYLKNAVMRTNRVFKFISARTIRPLFLWAGLFVFGFTAVIQWLIGCYGSFDAIPGTVKTAYFSGLILIAACLGYAKIQLIIRRVRGLGLEMTVRQMLREIYTRSTMVVFLPHIVTLGLATLYLATHGLAGYIVPCLAIGYGLLYLSLVNLIYLKELIAGGIWFLASGFLTLYLFGPSQPLPGVILTFGVGFMVMYAASMIFSGNDRN